jgi:hypothetical protein
MSQLRIASVCCIDVKLSRTTLSRRCQSQEYAVMRPWDGLRGVCPGQVLLHWWNPAHSCALPLMGRSQAVIPFIYCIASGPQRSPTIWTTSPDLAAAPAILPDALIVVDVKGHPLCQYNLAGTFRLLGADVGQPMTCWSGPILSSRRACDRLPSLTHRAGRWERAS